MPSTWFRSSNTTKLWVAAFSSVSPGALLGSSTQLASRRSPVLRSRRCRGRGLLRAWGAEPLPRRHDTDPGPPRPDRFALEELTERFTAIPARRLLCILDCCFSGGMGAKVLMPDVRVRGNLGTVEEALAKMSGQGRVVLTASSAAQEAWENGRLGHGFLTYHLIDALVGAGGRTKPPRCGCLGCSTASHEPWSRLPRRSAERSTPRSGARSKATSSGRSSAAGRTTPQRSRTGQRWSCSDSRTTQVRLRQQ